MSAVRLPFRNVGNVHLNDGDADGTDAVSNSDGGVGIGSRVHHHGIVSTVSFLKLVDQNAFVIGLKIGKLMLWETFVELG